MSGKSTVRLHGLLAAVMVLLWASLCGAETKATPVQGAGGGQAGDEYVRKSDLGFQWNGDARLRYEVMHNAMAGNGDTIHRLRARLRVGANGELADGKAFWGFRLETMTGNPTGANLNLRGGLGGDVGVGQAYMGYIPHEDVTITAGMFANPFGPATSEMVFDDDLNVQGANVGWDIFGGGDEDVIKNVHNDLALCFITLPAVGNSSFQYLVGDQLTLDLGPTEAAIGIFYFGGLRSAGPPRPNTGAGTYVEDGFAVIQGAMAYPFEIREFPLNVGGQAIYNAATDKQNFGWEVRLDAPELGPGAARVLLRDVGQYATFANWADSELSGGLGAGYHSGVEAGYTWEVLDGVDIGLTYYHWDSFAPLGTGLVPPSANNTFQIDASTDF